VKAGATGTQWRIKLTIIASEGHDKPETNQYLPAAGSGFTKTMLKGAVDVRALDGFDCVSGTDDPISWVSLIHDGNWVAIAS
jgi:hypothetical protein